MIENSQPFPGDLRDSFNRDELVQLVQSAQLEKISSLARCPRDFSDRICAGKIFFLPKPTSGKILNRDKGDVYCLPVKEALRFFPEEVKNAVNFTHINMRHYRFQNIAKINDKKNTLFYFVPERYFQKLLGEKYERPVTPVATSGAAPVSEPITDLL